MKLSKRTQAILKNFAGINQSIVINPGNVLQTISNVKDVFAKAEIEETFDTKVSIYDVNEFLGVLSLFEDPELEFTENSVKLSQGNMTQTYYYAGPSVITQPPEKGVSLPSVEVNASLTREQMMSLVKAAGLNDATSLTFTDGNVKVWNSQSPNANTFQITGVSETSANYELSIAVEKLKMVADDYDIEICAKGLSHFTGKQNSIEYFVALQPNGKYSA